MIMRDVFLPYPSHVLDVELDDPMPPGPIHIDGSPEGEKPVGYIEHWRISRSPLGVLIDIRATTDTGEQFLQAIADGYIRLSVSVICEYVVDQTEGRYQYGGKTRVNYPYYYDPAHGFSPYPLPAETRYS